ncbi:MAG: MarC family protein [Octadecabacter sp.]
MMEAAALITAFTTLFVIIDPIGLAPLFVALTQGMTPTQRRSIAVRSCAVAIGLLLMFALFGEAVLGFVGISMPAFRVAGGVLLFLTALDMLFERRQKRREDTAEGDGDTHHTPADDPSVFPLAIPLIAGPGSIATMILLVGQTDGIAGFAAVFGVLLAVMAIVFVFFMASGIIERALGKTGTNVVTRILGMLLAALAVQFILDGLRSFGFAS